MANSNVETWERAAVRYQQEYAPPVERGVPLGPGLPADQELRIVPGLLSGKRVVDLGCGAGQAAVAFAGLGARVIAVDTSGDQLAAARALADGAGARIDFHQCDLCELAFIPAESVELVFCAATLDYVEDLGRVLRSVHRVLQPKGAFVLTVEHPFSHYLDADGGVTATYGSLGPVKVERYGETFVVYPRTTAEIVTTLNRSGFKVEALAEPVPAGAKLPAAAVWRARKEGR